MDVRGTEGVAVVQQRGIDQGVVLWIIHQICQVTQMTVAPTDAVSSAVLVQDEYLTGTEPTLEKNTMNAQNYPKSIGDDFRRWTYERGSRGESKKKKKNEAGLGLTWLGSEIQPSVLIRI